MPVPMRTTGFPPLANAPMTTRQTPQMLLCDPKQRSQEPNPLMPSGHDSTSDPFGVIGIILVVGAVAKQRLKKAFKNVKRGETLAVLPSAQLTFR